MSFRRLQNRKVQVSWPDDAVCITEQFHKKTCDIKNIIAGLIRTGNIGALNPPALEDIDLTVIPDFQQAHEIMANAGSLWEEVPSSVKRQFNNDMREFVDFMSDSANYDAIGELGFDNSYLPKPDVPAASSEPSPASETPSESGE